MFGKIGTFFSKLGHRVKQVLGVIADSVTDDQISQAVTYVEQAEDKFADNAARREWVVAQLKGLGMPEWIARIAVEGALRLVKKGLHKVTEDAADAVANPT